MITNASIKYSVRHSKITDLKYKDYLKIDLSNFSYGKILKNFGNYSAEFIEKAKKSNLPQIQIKFPYRWNGFSEILKKFNYDTGLIFVEKNITKTYLPPEHLLEIKDTIILKNLLKKQQALHYKLNTKFFEKTKKFDLDSYLKELQINYEKNKGITYGIYEKDKLIAFIGLEILGSGIYINELFTDDKFRGRGLGKILMQAGFNYTAKLNFKKIWTTLAAQNESALRFYQARGFKPISKLFYINLV
ncbi:GNAT family N-acetyltransferase [Candidatus Peregrinibacteria bacterium]|nr:GNAT family N-acetyltransferase [Candidatus Peregrinibacteria bacterium]